MDECDKIGKSCPSNLKCLKKNGSFACDCENTGFIVKGSGERRTCQGTKSLLERLKVTFMANGPGSNPGVDAICGLSLLLVLSFAPRGFSPGSRSGFPLSSKNQHFQIPFRPGIIDDGTTMWLCNL